MFSGMFLAQLSLVQLALVATDQGDEEESDKSIIRSGIIFTLIKVGNLKGETFIQGKPMA